MQTAQKRTLNSMPTEQSLNWTAQNVSLLIYSKKKQEAKQELDETTKAELLQSELLESNVTNILVKRKLDEYDIAKKHFQELFNKKTNQMKEQSELDKLVKQLQVMRVEKIFKKPKPSK